MEDAATNGHPEGASEAATQCSGGPFVLYMHVMSGTTSQICMHSNWLCYTLGHTTQTVRHAHPRRQLAFFLALCFMSFVWSEASRRRCWFFERACSPLRACSACWTVPWGDGVGELGCGSPVGCTTTYPLLLVHITRR